MLERSEEELIACLENLRASQNQLPLANQFALQLQIDALEEELSQLEGAYVMRLIQPRHGDVLGLYPVPLRRQA